MLDIKQFYEESSKLVVLYVEDDLEIQANTQAIFEDIFKQVLVAKNGEEALLLYEKKSYEIDILITDINMPKINGLELIREVKKRNPSQNVIITSAYDETEYFINGIQSGIDGYILKPVDFEQLLGVVNKIVQIVKSKKENVEYKKNMEKLVEEKTQHLEKSKQTVIQMLTTDNLTGLPNANMLYEYLDYAKDKISIILYKIDNYTYLVQNYSKELCDEIVQNTADFLLKNTPKSYQVYKYFKDEFVILCDADSAKELKSLAQQVNAFFKETPIVEYSGKKDLYVTLSSALLYNENPENILQKAQATLNELFYLSMYGHYKMYEENSKYIQSLKPERKWFENIREIIENDNLIPYFHPIVSNSTQEIVKYECLVRANSDGEVISPLSFLESVKKAGLLSSVSKIMINKCFQFFQGKNIEFSLNITNDDLLDEHFADFILSKQILYKINPRNVILEILEDIILDEEYQTPINNLTKLQKAGFLIALDDFGSDRSNLNRLISMINFDFLKIDGQFIQNIDKNKKNFQIVSSIVSLTKKLGIQTIAEYVSTEEEYQVVKELKIDFSQGYFFFKPQKNITSKID